MPGVVEWEANDGCACGGKAFRPGGVPGMLPGMLPGATVSHGRGTGLHI